MKTDMMSLYRIGFSSFILFIAFAMIGLYLFLAPFEFKTKQQKEIAQIDIEDFRLLQFSEKSMIREISGDSAKHFSTHTDIVNFILNEYKNGHKEMLRAEYATYENAKVYLHNRVEYIKSNGFEFISQQLFYDDDVIYVPDSFIMKYGSGVAKARDMLYDRKNGTINADSIKAVFDGV